LGVPRWRPGGYRAMRQRQVSVQVRRIFQTWIGASRFHDGRHGPAQRIDGRITALAQLHLDETHRVAAGGPQAFADAGWAVRPAGFEFDIGLAVDKEAWPGC